MTEETLECDILVAGGGIAGVCCALAAARLGAQVRGNHQRRRVHHCQCPTAVTALRLTVQATNGLDHARVVEVRVVEVRVVEVRAYA